MGENRWSSSESSPKDLHNIGKELEALKVLATDNRACQYIVLETSASVQVRSEHPGPHVLLFGSIHGDEPSGALAILSLLEMIAQKKLSLTRGTLTCAIGNEKALRENKRYIDFNLNRLFLEKPPQAAESSYEWQRATELKRLIESADYMLDLHALSADSEPFLMCEEPLLTLARSIGSEHIVIGWGTLEAACLAGDTETYCHQVGVKGFTMESGQLADPNSTDTALKTAIAFLQTLNCLPGEPPKPQQTLYRLFAVQEKKHDDFRYSREFRNFDSLRKGELIGRTPDEEYSAPCDCAIVLPISPAHKAKVGEDLYLLANVYPA